VRAFGGVYAEQFVDRTEADRAGQKRSRTESVSDYRLPAGKIQIPYGDYRRAERNPSDTIYRTDVLFYSEHMIKKLD
jgi:hypothetical protein